MSMSAFAWMLYASDDGHAYALKVDTDYISQTERGWSTQATPDDYQYPRGWLPRRVIGLMPDGRIREAIVASVNADLWTSTATHFDIRDSSGVPVSCQVIGRRSERWLRIT